VSTDPAALRATALPGEGVHITTSPDTERFWEATKEGKLEVPQCSRCGHFRMPPTPYCPECQSDQVTWVEQSGDATVFSFSVVHGFPGLPDITLVPIVVDLPDAAPARLVSNLVDVDPADVFIGMQVRVAFHPIADGNVLPVFTVAGS
jgi:uncharacterized OB-fold protein